MIDYNGDVRACELREKFASLRDFDCDFGALWQTGERQTELGAIDGGKACWCTHVCLIHSRCGIRAKGCSTKFRKII